MIKLNEILPTSRVCLNCVYFERFEEQKKDSNVIGACKANPPIPASYSDKNSIGKWPTVLATTWCGMFNFPEKQ